MLARIRLVITDLDNTLYDWVSFFAPAFYAMVAKAVEILGVDEDQLLDELRDVHRRHHNSEHPYALLETSIVQKRLGHKTQPEQLLELDEAFHEFNRKRKELLVLYPTVSDTLEYLASAGVSIVAHTEATVPNATFRLEKLGISRFFVGLYAVMAPEQMHPNPKRAADVYPWPVHRLSPDERKPNPGALLRICQDFGVQPAEVLYVGDSVPRDIGMAKEAGTWAALAKYGALYDRALWDKLVRITHWTNDDVLRAEDARQKYGSVEADLVLNYFGELLQHFDFDVKSAQSALRQGGEETNPICTTQNRPLKSERSTTRQ